MSREKSNYVMVVYFKDGNRGRFYSRDKRNSSDAVKQRSLSDFAKKLQGDYSDKYVTAIIYENEDHGREVHKFVSGKQIF